MNLPRFLQILDVSVNKLFKFALKKQYLNFQQENLNTICENKFNVNNEDIIKNDFGYMKQRKRHKKKLLCILFYYGISELLDGS